jgi:acylphosphatase
MEGRRLLITGRVQGVGFRYNMVAAAERLGASGWVRNRADGSVEAQIHGTPEIIAALLNWARQGPPGARVDNVSVEFVEGEFDSFSLRPTE